jgi:hypothetical protein
MSKITKRLSRDTQYNKTKKSYQESLSPDEIKQKLEEYKMLDDIKEVSLNSHIRYFTINPKTGDKQFRLGGFVTKIEDEYIILSNNNISWSVQIKNTVFFIKMSFNDMKEELIKKINKKNENEMNALKEENKKLKATLKQVKNQVKKKDLFN